MNTVRANEAGSAICRMLRMGLLDEEIRLRRPAKVGVEAPIVDHDVALHSADPRCAHLPGKLINPGQRVAVGRKRGPGNPVSA
jgi:hypothetical protein